MSTPLICLEVSLYDKYDQAEDKFIQAVKKDFNAMKDIV